MSEKDETDKILKEELEKYEKIDEEFNKLVSEELTDEEWKEWVWSWLDLDIIVNMYKNWGAGIKKDYIKDLKKIIKKRKKKVIKNG